MDKSITIYFVFLFCMIAIMVFCLIHCCKEETKGALYLNEDGKAAFVCNGVLTTRSTYTLQFGFRCEDGREISNLTNFTLKAVEK